MPTLHTSEKTDPGMLPQSQALESASADNREGKGETGRGGQGDLTTGVQHGREEIPGGLTNRQERSPSSSEQSGGEGDRDLATPPSITASYVFVLDKHGHPLMPCHPARARKLLRSGRARVHHLVPFVIRLVDRETQDSEVPGVVVKIDPGSKHTGMVVARVDDVGVTHGLVSIQLDHRGQQMRKKMQQRAGYRRRRRTKNLRYRKPRWRNRHPEACRACGKNAKHKKGYCGPCQKARNFVDNGYRRHRLPPSLQHRVDTTVSWVSRIRRWAPVVGLAQELVRFDTQAMENPEISGVEYQQGTLAGYEMREYLLEKWGRKCAYCGTENVPLQVEHIVPKIKGGPNRASNLTLACKPCNDSKTDTDVRKWCEKRFGKKRGSEIVASVLAQAKVPLKDAAAINATRWALWRALLRTGLPVHTGSGGRTKWNRNRFHIPKSHTLDAICVGEVVGIGAVPTQVLVVTCTGRGQHQRTRPDKYGFPRLYLPRTKQHHGLCTGDLVRAVVPHGKHVGTHVGRVAIRTSGNVRVGKKDGINAKYCTILQRADGYGYEREEEAPLLPAPKGGVSGAR